MIEVLTQFMPMFSVVWIAWWAKRRVEQCEARCTRELERVLAQLPMPPAPPGVTVEEPPVLVLEQPPSPLPVARALKA